MCHHQQKQLNSFIHSFIQQFATCLLRATPCASNKYRKAIFLPFKGFPDWEEKTNGKAMKEGTGSLLGHLFWL